MKQIHITIKQKLFTVIFAALVLNISACEPKPQEINLGSDQCEYCRMMITEAEFGSQALNMQGRSFKFDSVECLAAFDITNENADNIHSLWVPDFLNRDEWLEATTAVYLHSESLRSPMGLFLSAYRDYESALTMKEEYGGEISDYTRVKQIVSEAWLNGSSSHQNHH